MEEQRFKPFIVTTIIGMVIWTCVVGFMHTYIISVDWNVLQGKMISQNYFTLNHLYLYW